MDKICTKGGALIPKLGFGTADISGSVKDAVCCAIAAGHRLIDTAQVYGSEPGVGEAMAASIKDGLVRRDDLFVQTKLAPEKGGYRETMDAFDASLNQLQTDYVDMFMFHWPVARGFEDTYRERNIETWRAMMALKAAGRVRYIGVCNFLERHLLQLMESGETPAANQLELHPGFQQRGLVRFCRERGIAIEAWSPMGRGILRTPAFDAMGTRYGKSTAQLALRWSLQKGFIPLSRSSDAKHIAQNLDVLDFEISVEDMQKLDALNTCDGHMDIWSYKRQQMY